MAMINIDLSATPNEMPLIEIGDYDFEITSAEFGENKNKDGFVVTTKMKVVSDGPMKGRSVMDFIPVNMNDPKENVRLRLFTLSALGTIPKGGIDLDAVKGKVVRASIVHRPDKDKTKMYANVDKYIVPKDVLDANPVVK